MSLGQFFSMVLMRGSRNSTIGLSEEPITRGQFENGTQTEARATSRKG
jgi:hypothetical protein